jgi:hypothetical protein
MTNHCGGVGGGDGGGSMWRIVTECDGEGMECIYLKHNEY